MSNEPVCVCGHIRSQHHFNVGTGCMMDECWKPDHRCLEFREALDWPDSEGWWWCRQKEPRAMRIVGLVYYDKMIDRLRLVESGRDDLTHVAVMLAFGPMVFTKLLEQNPFKD